MIDPEAKWFDTKLFTEQLTLAIEAALRRSLHLFRGEVVSCLALDIHPDSGFLNLCMRMETDESGWLADWKHASFAAAYGHQNWPEGLAVAETMEKIVAEYLEDTEDYEGFERPFLICAVNAFANSRIADQLSHLSQSSDFEYYVGESNNPDSRNYCHELTNDQGNAERPKRRISLLVPPQKATGKNGLPLVVYIGSEDAEPRVWFAADADEAAQIERFCEASKSFDINDPSTHIVEF